MYHGAGCTTALVRFAMCCRDTSSTSPSSVYEYGTPALASVSSDSGSCPVAASGPSSDAMSVRDDDAGRRTSRRTSIARPETSSMIASGADETGVRVNVQCVGRFGIGAPNRYRPVTTPLSGSPASIVVPVSVTSTRKSGLAVRGDQERAAHRLVPRHVVFDLIELLFGSAAASGSACAPGFGLSLASTARTA